MENEIAEDKNEVSTLSKKSAQPDKKQKFIQETKSLSLILFLILIFRSVFFEPFRIPSGSMIPTLMIGDFILVNKFAYGFKVPFSDFFSDPIYLFGKSNPKRGDVVVFKYPQDKSINYIKRVVAIEGDTIEIKDKILYVNDIAVNMDEITETEKGKEVILDMDEKFKGYNLKIYNTSNGDAKHVIQQDADNYYKTNYERRSVPKGNFFVMGDNRDFSYDSRFWGFVPHELIKGRALFVWFSMIIPLEDHPFKFRPWRIGTLIK